MPRILALTALLAIAPVAAGCSLQADGGTPPAVEKRPTRNLTLKLDAAQDFVVDASASYWKVVPPDCGSNGTIPFDGADGQSSYRKVVHPASEWFNCPTARADRPFEFWVSVTYRYRGTRHVDECEIPLSDVEQQRWWQGSAAPVMWRRLDVVAFTTGPTDPKSGHRCELMPSTAWPGG
jgi:hypothetical protein